MTTRGRRAELPPPALRRPATIGAAVVTVLNLGLFVRWADTNTVSVLHNASARRAELGLALLAAGCGLVALLAARTKRIPPWESGAVLALSGFAAGIAGTAALLASDHETLLVDAPVLEALPAAALVAFGVVRAASHDTRATVLLGVAAVLAAVIAALTVLHDATDELLLEAGRHASWSIVRDIDEVTVTRDGTVWSVRSSRAGPDATLFRRDPGAERFVEVGTWPTGWAPTVVGTDSRGRTWLVRSEADDPFLPIVEVIDQGVVERLVPPKLLPPLDTVTLDVERGRLYGFHTDLRIPSDGIIEALENGRWWTIATPITGVDRLGRPDLAVDDRGRLWLWHSAEPTAVHVLDEGVWATVALPFEPEPLSRPDDRSTTLNAFRMFVRSADGRLWVHDPATGVLTTLGAQLELVPSRHRAPSGCIPMMLDSGDRLWCATTVGVQVIDGERLVYRTITDGIPAVTVDEVAVGPVDAWARARRGRSDVILRFAYPQVLEARS